MITALAAVLAGCALPRLRGTAWDHRDPRDCLEPHQNGLWERHAEHCRDGRGFLVWAAWIY